MRERSNGIFISFFVLLQRGGGGGRETVFRFLIDALQHVLRPNTMLTNYGSLTQGYGIPSMHGISKGRGRGGGEFR